MHPESTALTPQFLLPGNCVFGLNARAVGILATSKCSEDDTRTERDT